MFRMIFDQNVLITVEEKLSAWVCAYVAIGLLTQLVLMRMQLVFMRTWTCSCVRVFVLQFIWMQVPICVRMPSACVRRCGPAYVG